MATSKAPKLDLAKEVKKLTEYLALPITHIEFDPRYEYGKLYTDKDWNIIWINAKLFVNDELIGTIPYFSSDNGFGYDTGNHSIFAWDKIYQQFEQVIFSKIRLQEPLAFTTELCTLGPEHYLILDIKDKAGTLIKRASCRFINGEWNVSVSGLDTVTVLKRIKIVLTPPPSPGATDTQKSLQ